jgi:hypothetical protein
MGSITSDFTPVRYPSGVPDLSLIVLYEAKAVARGDELLLWYGDNYWLNKRVDIEPSRD